MIEKEIEIKVKTLNQVRGYLRNKGKLEKRLKSHDYFFDETLFSKDVILRLRDITYLFPNKKREAVVTFKSPKKVKRGIQSRKELEFVSNDFKSVFAVFESIFANPVLRFSWTGEKYLYKDCTIWLKDTIGIVKFVEIEGNPKDIQILIQELNIKGEVLNIGALEYAKRVIRGDRRS